MAETENETQKSEIRCVYVAGAYDGKCATDIQANMRRGLELSLRLLNAGFSPFCPWLDWQFGMLQEVTREQYLRYSMDWLRKADVVIVVAKNSEQSRGTQDEVEEARRLKKAIFWDYGRKSGVGGDAVADLQIAIKTGEV